MNKTGGTPGKQELSEGLSSQPLFKMWFDDAADLIGAVVILVIAYFVLAWFAR